MHFKLRSYENRNTLQHLFKIQVKRLSTCPLSCNAVKGVFAEFQLRLPSRRSLKVSSKVILTWISFACWMVCGWQLKIIVTCSPSGNRHFRVCVVYAHSSDICVRDEKIRTWMLSMVDFGCFLQVWGVVFLPQNLTSNRSETNFFAVRQLLLFYIISSENESHLWRYTSCYLLAHLRIIALLSCSRVY